MSSFFMPKQRALDANGDPISGGLLYFYETGTVTPLDTYPTEADQLAATNANANPVVADANGWFGSIFLKTDQEYTVVLKDADEVTLWTVNNVDAVQLSGVDLSNILNQLASNPIKYGAIGDGAADETSYVQDAIDNATRVVDLLGKTYRCDSAITLTSGIEIRNGTLNFGNCTDPEYIKIQGSVGTYTNLTGNATYQADSVAVTSASGFSADDLASLISSGTYCADGQQGELCEIRDIASLTFTMTSEIMDAYTTANTARLAKVTPHTNCKLQNISISANNAVATSNTRVIAAYATKGLVISNVDIGGVKDYGILLAGCIDTIIEGCTINNSAGAGVGILLEEATQDCTIRGCTFRTMMVGVDTDTTLGLAGVPFGVRRRVTIQGNTFELSTSYDLAMKIGQDSQYIKILDNEIFGGGSGANPQIDIDCVDFELRGNTLSGNTGDGFDIDFMAPGNSGRGYSIKIRDNVLRSADSSADIAIVAAAVTGGAGALTLLEVEGNTISGDIVLSASATGADITSLLVANNDALSASFNGTNVTVGDLSFRGNRLGGAVAKTLTITDINRVHVSGNTFVGDGSTTTHAIHEVSASGNLYSRYVNNYIQGTTNYGILVDCAASSKDVIIASNDIIETYTNNGYAGIHINESSRYTIDGNFVDADGYGIWCDNTSRAFSGATINGNTVRASLGQGTTSTGIVVVPGTSSAYCVISGNDVYNVDGTSSTYCLWVSGILNRLAVTGNIFTRANDNDANVLIAGTGAGDIQNVVIGNNIITNGDVGIELTNVSASTVQLPGNIYDSCTVNVSGNAYGMIALADATTPDRAALRVVPQDTAPATAQAGDVYCKSSGAALIRYNGTGWTGVDGLFYAGTGTTDTRTTSGKFSQTCTIPANTLIAGNVVRVTAGIDVTSACITPSGAEIARIDFGGTALGQSPTIDTTLIGDGAVLVGTFVFHTIGASAEVGYAHVGAAALSNTSFCGTHTADTTSSIVISVELFNISDTPTLELQTLVVEILG